VPNAERVEDVLAHRLACFRAQTSYGAGRIVALQGSQVDAGDRTEEPRGLPGFLYAPPGGAAWRRGVRWRCDCKARLVEPVEVERQARVARRRRGEAACPLAGATRRDADARTDHLAKHSTELIQIRTAAMRRRLLLKPSSAPTAIAARPQATLTQAEQPARRDPRLLRCEPIVWQSAVATTRRQRANC